MATPKELSIEKMKCFLKGGANGDELDEGLLSKRSSKWRATGNRR